MLRETYAEIDLSKIRHNIRLLKAAAKTHVMAVVKADAYGHGMIPVAQAAWAEGVRWFAVATPDEAVGLRREFADAGILVLSPVLNKALTELIDAEVSIAVCSAADLKNAAAAAKAVGKSARVHIKADTGMGRVGLRSDDELAAMLDIFAEDNAVTLEGLFTHFATADEADKTYSMQQLAKYCHFRDLIHTAVQSPPLLATFARMLAPLPSTITSSACLVALPPMSFWSPPYNPIPITP